MYDKKLIHMDFSTIIYHIIWFYLEYLLSPWTYTFRIRQPECVFYYCRTYYDYKAVRVGGKRVEDMC